MRSMQQNQRHHSHTTLNPSPKSCFFHNSTSHLLYFSLEDASFNYCQRILSTPATKEKIRRGRRAGLNKASPASSPQHGALHRYENFSNLLPPLHPLRVLIHSQSITPCYLMRYHYSPSCYERTAHHHSSSWYAVLISHYSTFLLFPSIFLISFLGLYFFYILVY